MVRDNMFKEVINDESIYINQLLTKELNTFIKFEKNLRKKKRVKSGFCLMDSLIKTMKDENASVLGFYLEVAKPYFNKYNYIEKKRAIGKYLLKKKERRHFNLHKGKERKEMADKRLRCKGKFIKKPKINLEEVAKEFERQREKGFI